MSQTPRLRIVFPLYPGVTHLDFTGPHQVLCRAPGAEVIVASLGGADIGADGLAFSSLVDLRTIEACDVLCVPGGPGTAEAMLDDGFLSEIRRLASTARYLTSVCTGSLILGAAGLLRNRRAACHWAARDLLPLFGAIPDPGRVVRDGHVITGGGVTAGIDFAFTLLAELAGEEVAKTVQLGLEYAPAPPFLSGTPEEAGPERVAAYLRDAASRFETRRANAESAARRMA
jgi:putative intracellular protease/amidase